MIIIRCELAMDQRIYLNNHFLFFHVLKKNSLIKTPRMLAFIVQADDECFNTNAVKVLFYTYVRSNCNTMRQFIQRNKIIRQIETTPFFYIK